MILVLSINRENHEHESGKILKNDVELKKYFNNEQIKIMKEAVEDHRGLEKKDLEIFMENVFQILIEISILNYWQKDN